MENEEERPTVRVVKAPRHRLKSGVIRVQGEDGKTYFRAPCDRCQTMTKVDFQPREDRELYCRDCRWIAAKAKPSTRVKRRGDKVLYYTTECDLCGDRQKTPFLPKKDRRFLCDGCFEAEKEQRGTVQKPEKSKSHAVQKPEKSTSRETGSEPIVPKAEIAAEPETVKPTEAAAATDTSPEAPLFDVYCRRCHKVEQMRFKPARGEYFLCKDCYLAERTREEAKKHRPDTRLLFQIECAICGKQETVGFVPRDLTEPVCSSCHEKRKKRRKQ